MKRSSAGQVVKLLYRREEAAFALGLSVKSINRLLASHSFRYRRFEGVVLIPATEVARLADEIMAGSESLVVTRPPGRFLASPQRSEPKVQLPLVTPETLWTVREVAKRLHKGESTVNMWMSKGLLKKTKAAGSTLITEKDLQEFIRKSTASADAVRDKGRFDS